MIGAGLIFVFSKSVCQPTWFRMMKNGPISDFVPDTCTLGFYHAYQVEPDNWTLKYGDHSWFFISAISEIYSSGICITGNLEYVLRSAIGVTEHLPNVRLNQAMMDVAISRIKNCDLPPDAWQRLLTAHQLTNCRLVSWGELSSITSGTVQKSTTKKKRKLSPQNGIPLYAILTKVLRADSSGRKKRASADALAEIDELQLIEVLN